ncbi:hypothetical protein FOL47_009545 [Perkinsus chesapeaki]|uniref:Uncharacterized protein n=1 Tax=Perkinsus chesapeaki TaxID=330153 RepID=A0A7J6L7P6_PERCH|nr:hypothetical protein FOL47_009545 [Perkinsus chesapeaki]
MSQNSEVRASSSRMIEHGHPGISPEEQKEMLMSASRKHDRLSTYHEGFLEAEDDDGSSICSECDGGSSSHGSSRSTNKRPSRGTKRVRGKGSICGSLRKLGRTEQRDDRKLSCSTNSSDNCHTVAELSEESRQSRSDLLTEDLCGPAFMDYCKCDDPQDPVSLQRIWTEGPEGGRAASGEIEFLFSYHEDGKFIRGFSVTTLQYLLRQPRPIQHPVSRKVIPESTLERAERMVKCLEATGAIEPLAVRDLASIPHKELTRKDMQQLSLEVWQLMARQSVYVEEDTLVDMDRAQLVMVNSELRSMFTENFTVDQRQQFYPPDGIPFAKIHEALVSNGEDISPLARTLGAVQGILRDLRTVGHVGLSEEGRVKGSVGVILTNAPDNIKFMVSYVIVGALAVVSSPIRARYMTGLSHSFEIPPSPGLQEDYSSEEDDDDHIGEEEEEEGAASDDEGDFSGGF